MAYNKLAYLPVYNGRDGYGSVTGGGAPKIAAILGATFDGVADYLTRGSDYTGNADSKIALIAFRIRMLAGSDGSSIVLATAAGSKIAVQRQADNTVKVFCRNAANVTVLDMTTTSTLTADGNYHNFVVGVDTSSSGGCLIYHNDVDVTNLVTRVDDLIDMTTVEHTIGAAPAFTNKLAAEFNFLYGNYAQTLDVSAEATRRKFFTASGAVAISPFGNGVVSGLAQPLIYHAGRYDQWHINKGTGGGMTVTGALSEPTS